MRTRAWGWLVLLPLAVGVAVVATAPFLAFHPDLVLAGTPGRFAATVVRAGRSDARTALWFDNVFAVVWLLTVPALLRVGRDRWAPQRRAAVGWWRHAPAVAVAAGLCNLVENSVALALVGKGRPGTWATLPLEVVGWTTIALSAVTAVGMLGLVVGPLTAPLVRPLMQRLVDRDQVPTVDDVAQPPARRVLVRVVAVAGLVVSATVLVSAALGRFVRTRVVHPAFPEAEVVAEQLGVVDLLPARLVVPPVVLVVLGALVRAAGRRSGDQVRSSCGAGIAAYGVGLGAVLIAAPALLLGGRQMLDALPLPGGPDGPAGVVLGLALVVVVVGVRRVLRGALGVGHLRALHVAVPTALVVVAGKVADTFAYDEAPLWTEWPIDWIDARVTLVAIAVLWAAAVALVPAHRLSLAALSSADGRRWDGHPRDLAARAGAWEAQQSRIAPAAPTDRALAVLGLLPGDWVAHPQRAAWFTEATMSPRVHVGHLVLTVLGRYRPQSDAFVRTVALDEAGAPVALGS